MNTTASSTVERTDSQRLSEAEARLDVIERTLRTSAPQDSLCLVLFSGDLDRLLAGFMMATGASACGMQVDIFVTFWALAALRKPNGSQTGKSLLERSLGWMLPRGASRSGLSRLNFLGLGRRLIQSRMQAKGIPTLSEFIELAGTSDVNIVICDTARDLLGLERSDLIDYPHLQTGGVATFLEKASNANTTLFI